MSPMCQHTSLAVLFLLIGTGAGWTETLPTAATEVRVAVLQFQAAPGVDRDLCGNVPELISVALSGRPGLAQVERLQIDKISAELDLGRAGLLGQSQTLTLGMRLGADLVVTGRMCMENRALACAVEISSCHTGQVLGASDSAGEAEGVGPLCERLAERIAAMIRERKETMAPGEPPFASRLTAVLGEPPWPTRGPRVYVTAADVVAPEQQELSNTVVNKTRACLAAANVPVQTTATATERVIAVTVVPELLATLRDRASVRVTVSLTVTDAGGIVAFTEQGTQTGLGQGFSPTAQTQACRLAEQLVLRVIARLREVPK